MRKQGIHGFLLLRASSMLTSWGPKGARQKPGIYKEKKRERKAPEPKAGESEEEAGAKEYGAHGIIFKEHGCGWRKTTILSPHPGTAYGRSGNINHDDNVPKEN